MLIQIYEFYIVGGKCLEYSLIVLFIIIFLFRRDYLLGLLYKFVRKVRGSSVYLTNI